MKRKPQLARGPATGDARHLAVLDDITGRLPAMECRGKCQAACTAIDMSGPEHRRIVRETGIDIPRSTRGAGLLRVLTDGPQACPALTMLGTCAAYRIRPTVCILWGMVEAMSCPHGCQPEGGWLDERTGAAILMVSQSADRGRSVTFDEAYEYLAYLEDPMVRHAWRNDMAAGSNPYSDVIRETARTQLAEAIARWQQGRAPGAAVGVR